MADGTVVANAGSGGAAFKVDLDAGNAVWPYAKQAFGPSGTQTEVADTDGSRLPTKPTGPRGSLTEKSGTIAAGGTSQVLAVANASRQFIRIWNPPSETEPLFIRFGSAATQDHLSVMLEPGADFKMSTPEFVSTQAINVVAATTGHAFTAMEG